MVLHKILHFFRLEGGFLVAAFAKVEENKKKRIGVFRKKKEVL